MNDYICDIETATDHEALDKINRFYPFKPEDVNLDPRWKPETCEAKIEEARNNHLPKMLNKAQLDPALSFICSFGLLAIDSDEPKLRFCYNPSEEKDALEWIFDKMNSRVEPIRLIGYNLMDFDLEFMWRRAWHHRIKPPMRMRKGRYWNPERVVDLMDEFAFNNSKNPWISLEKVVMILGIGCPERPQGVTGRDFCNLIFSDDPIERGMGEAYARSDLFEERDLARIIL